MRILMLSQFYPPITGGEEHHVRDLAGELAARGHAVSVATLRHSGDPTLAIDDGVRVYRIRGWAQRAPGLFSEDGRRHTPPFPDPGLMWSLRRIIARERPEIVHAHNWLVHSFLPLKPWSRARLVMSLHDYSLTCAVKTLAFNDGVCRGPGLGCLPHAIDHYGPAKGIPIAVANWVMSAFERSSVDMFLAVSEAVVNGNRLAGGKAPFKVIPNFLSDELSPSGDWQGQLDRLPGDPFLLFVGDLRTFKGIRVLVRAHADLSTDLGSKAPPLVLIGRMLSDTPREFPPNVLVLGKWPHEAVMAALPRSLAVLLPSIGPETFGIAALEAMASGRPVIASRIGGLPDVVADGETGLLVPPGDSDALRAAMQRILEEPDLATQMGIAAKLRAAHFRADSIVPLIEQVYHDVLATKPAAAIDGRR
ncbi:MAG: glycosyltransferase family 4 protein [Chloroflexi bacterium]|nr:glycosyltransferase family 4 protein [Chloroflexota bacterium]